MQTLTSLLRAIPLPDSAAMLRAQQHIDGLLKPPEAWGDSNLSPYNWPGCLA